MLKKINAFVFILSISSLTLAAIDDDMRAATESGLKRIENDKNACRKNATTNGVASACLEKAIPRNQVLLDALTDIRARQANGDTEELLNIYGDQEKFNNLMKSCETLLALSNPNTGFDFTYQCQLNLQKLYFELL